MGCGCSRHLKDLRSCDTSSAIGNSSKKLDFATKTGANEVDHATLATLDFSSVEEQIERSKAHWSTLTDHSGYTDVEELDFEVSNLLEFEALQNHPTWGSFFGNFTGDGISTGLNSADLGELVLGNKFAEGGQAELYEVKIKWNNQKHENARRIRREYVLKVFEGTLLKHVKSQLPQGVLLSHVKSLENLRSPTPKEFAQYLCEVHFGILLKGGRFAFLMRKQHFDLRTLIERNMKLRSGNHCGPFSKEEAQSLMYLVALGVESLHNRGIVHRDLKASNVLMREFKKNPWPKWVCYVADYECSIGVVGTYFFRAPEILQVCNDHKINERPEVFTRAADVYSYGMTCYEILTGKLPFEDHPLRYRSSLLTDLVINQHLRPEIPKYVEDWARVLLGRCWQFDPIARPRIDEILNVLSTNSIEVGEFEDFLKERYGENYRSLE